MTFAPVGWIVPLALEKLRRGGTLAVNAVSLTPIPEMDYQLIYYERTLTSVANATYQMRTGFQAFQILYFELLGDQDDMRHG